MLPRFPFSSYFYHIRYKNEEMFSLRPKTIDFDKVWGDLRPSVLEIIKMQPITKKDWDHKFCDVYEICVAIPDPLSDRLYRSLVSCLEEHVAAVYTSFADLPTNELLEHYYRSWLTYYSGTVCVHNLFGYLNKQFVKVKRNLDPDVAAQYAPYLQKTEIKEVGCLALEIWKTNLVEPILEQLVSLLLSAIADDRNGNPPANKTVIQGVIMSLVQVEQYEFNGVEETAGRISGAKGECSAAFYQKQFEVPFMLATEEFYSQLAQQLLADLSCSQYMERVIDVIDAEKQRACSYLHKTSVDKVISKCQSVMISAHKEKLNAVCSDLIKNEERKDLHNMYKLLKPISGGLTVMVKEFEEYVKKKGHEAILSLSGDNIPQQFVENILQVYDKYSEMKSTIFMDDGDFAGALDKALQNVVNARIASVSGAAGASKASERLARYSDSLLRKSARGLSETDLDEKLTRAIVIFRYIEDKDVFQKFYSKMLSNRLIHGISLSMDSEELMINKLKQACGYEFTCKLSRMFTDIGLCQELSDQFNKHLDETNVQLNTTILPIVLTAGSWPLAAPTAGGSGCPPSHVESVGFVLPPEMSQCVSEFQKYYLAKHNGRKLSWLYHTSHGELRTNYLDKSYVIQMSAFQMAALLCFNRHEMITVGDMSASIGITGEMMIKLVRALADGGMITYTDRDPIDTTEIRLNMSMSSKRIRFKLPAVASTKQVEKEVEVVNNTIAQDRKYYIECAVVRIMKTRKVMKHAQLVAEVMEQIKGRFKPDVSLVKKCIEDLIDKLYLQRTDQNDEYQYLA